MRSAFDMLSAEVFAWESCLPLAWACASNEYGGIENDSRRFDHYAVRLPK